MTHSKAKIAPGPEQPGRPRVDRPVEGALRHPRHAASPRTSARPQSHGCIRLTNWDALELGGGGEARHAGGAPGVTAVMRSPPVSSRSACSWALAAHSSYSCVPGPRRRRVRAARRPRSRRSTCRPAVLDAAPAGSRRPRPRRPPAVAPRKAHDPRRAARRRSRRPPVPTGLPRSRRPARPAPGRARPGHRPHELRDNFAEERAGHVHEAIDILAPRGTPVLAVEDGRSRSSSRASRAA